MKIRFRMMMGAAAVGATLLLVSLEAKQAAAQNGAESDVAALKGEIEALKRVVPSQSHAMADVDYQFSNLWFAGRYANWPLAEFYLNETRSHLNWAVRIRPVRKLSSGAALDLRPMLQGVESSSLTQLRNAIEKRDAKAFDAAYRQTLTECYACHKLAEKPYLRPQIPESPASRMINMHPDADWPK
jgi:DNA-binding GntR family transcriptional regulator